MEKRSIYSGLGSCYAEKEGLYVKEGVMDIAKAAAHLYLHMLDLERGYTYDHRCNRIKMTPDLFETRSNFLIKLCVEQVGRGCEEVAKLVDYVLKNFELPDWAAELAKKKIIKIQRLF